MSAVDALEKCLLPQSQKPMQCFKQQEPRNSGQIIADVIVGFGDAFLIPILAR